MLLRKQFEKLLLKDIYIFKHSEEGQLFSQTVPSSEYKICDLVLAILVTICPMQQVVPPAGAKHPKQQPQCQQRQRSGCSGRSQLTQPVSCTTWGGETTSSPSHTRLSDSWAPEQVCARPSQGSELRDKVSLNFLLFVCGFKDLCVQIYEIQLLDMSCYLIAVSFEFFGSQTS